jgi:BON domain
MGKHFRTRLLKSEDFFRAPKAHSRAQDFWRFLGKALHQFSGSRTDSAIAEEVGEVLANHPAIDSQRIRIEVHDGIVLLQGLVRDRWTKRAAEWAVENIRGVRDVENLLELRPWREPPSRSA